MKPVAEMEREALHRERVQREVRRDHDPLPEDGLRLTRQQRIRA
jgi:hypothetical protein